MPPAVACGPSDDGLSARQRRVSTLLAAAQLRVSAHDVRDGLDGVMLVLGARFHLEAVLIALRRRLIRLPAE
jgi:hypothetical protein